MEITLKEMNLRIFRGESLPHVFFQPRIEPWFHLHKNHNTLPPELQNLSIKEAYNFIGASMRYIHYWTGQPDPIEVRFNEKVKITEENLGNKFRRYYQTPYGDLFETFQFTPTGVYINVEFLAKKVDDLKALRWLLEHRTITFNPEKFKSGAEFMGDIGEPQFWVPKSPYFALAQQLMKYEDFIFTLSDYPSEIEDVMKVIDDSYDQLYEQLTSSNLPHIINFGENFDMAYTSPQYFEEYMIPWYTKRSEQLRKAGIFTYIHIDGSFKPILPYLPDLPFDGYEALTPTPQGDVTLEEMKGHIGDKILLDGIPAILFLEHYSREELQACVEKIVKFFHPRLVLGVSDELPEGGGLETYERLKWVAEWCLKHRD